MARVCVRPGCDRDAQARLTHDVISCQVWIDPIADWPGGSQEICDLHLARLTVPRGWMLCDRRGEAPSLFVADTDAMSSSAPGVTEPVSDPTPPTPTAAPAGRPGRRRARSDAGDASPDLVLFTHAAPATTAPDPAQVLVDPEPSESAPVDPADAPAAAAAGGAAESLTEEPDAEPLSEGGAEGEGAGEGPTEAEPASPSSPLLARAFAAAGPQRSVLTHYVEKRSSESD